MAALLFLFIYSYRTDSLRSELWVFVGFLTVRIEACGRGEVNVISGEQILQYYRVLMWTHVKGCCHYLEDEGAVTVKCSFNSGLSWLLHTHCINDKELGPQLITRIIVFHKVDMESDRFLRLYDRDGNSLCVQLWIHFPSNFLIICLLIA